MKRESILKVLFVVVTVLALPMILWAQSARTNTGPKYDPANETKIKGVVEDLKVVPGSFEGIHLMLRSGGEAVLVHVAPERYLKEMETEFAKGDQIEVVGCKIKAEDGSDEFLARQITKNGNELMLRDKKGVPVWAMWDPTKKQ